MNVPPVFDKVGVEGEIKWHLAECQKKLLRKGLLRSDLHGTPLPEIKVTWQQNTQGKGRNKAEQNLSLNKLIPFQENGCMVCTVEASERSWAHLGPLWEHYHRTGLVRRSLGRSALVIVMYNGRPTDNDRLTMQRLRRVNVVHAHKTTVMILPHIQTVHKQVEVEMADGSKPPHKFTDLCREVMYMESSVPTDSPVFLFDAIIPIVSGMQNGSATVTFREDNAEAHALLKKIRKCVAGWFFGYWTMVKKYKLGMVRKLMESFDVDAALLARFAQFDPDTLAVKTTFGDVDEQLDRIEEDLGIDQGWTADLEPAGALRVDLVGHREALAMTLRDRVEDADDANRIFHQGFSFAKCWHDR